MSEAFALIAFFLLGGGLGFLIARKFFTAAPSGAFIEAREKAARLEAENRALREKAAQHEADFKNTCEKLNQQFENMANRIFREKSEEFKKQSQEGLGILLDPLKQRLQDFQLKVEEHAKVQFSLQNEVARIVTANDTMSREAANLASALKGNSKVQGDWGEHVLEKILEDSGLQAGSNYIVQAMDMGLASAEDGKRLRPDIIIKLPENRHIVVDSKVSLTHYEQFCREEEPEKRAHHLRNYLASVQKHVCELAARGYQHADGLNTPDFVLMFLPTEGAYITAMQNDAALHSFAWDKKIVIVCPATLFATLRTIASIWRLELQNQNAKEIARQGGALYDKIAGFVDDMQRLGKQIGAAGESFDGAMGKLANGKGNILGRAENLRKLGAKATKALPPTLVGEEEDGEEETTHSEKAAE